MIEKYIKINLASPKKILKWSERSLPNGNLIGKITKSDTINYKDSTPIMEGLFCEKIFGPTKTNECACKLYKKIRIKMQDSNIIICPKCNVQITDSKIRRYRMGYIELNSPAVHPWFTNNTPNYIATVLGKSTLEIKRIIYTYSYIFINFKNIKEWKTGGEAIKILLKKIKLKKITNQIIGKKIEQKEIKKRIKFINFFINSKTKPEWMTISILPVLPPDLRPIINLQNNITVASELNFLYAKIINSNNRVIQFKNMKVDEKFIKKEIKVIQETIDSLINNSKNKKEKNNKSLSENIKGKHGRIRENLLGKTVDYSARSVITVEPKLKINECGIPEIIILELFQAILIKKIMQLKFTTNIKEAKRYINVNKILIKKILEQSIKKMRIKQ